MLASGVHLKRIWLYPIKSLDGLEVPEAEISLMGSLRGDREWAIVDSEGNFINGKRSAQIHRIRTRFREDRRKVSMSLSHENREPVEFDLKYPAPMEAWLSEALKQTVRIIQDSEQGFPDDLEANGPTLVGEKSLEEVAGWFELEIEETRRRFRTNLEVGNVPPFWEDRLYGAKDMPQLFHIGKVHLEACNPCQRCAVPTRDSMTGTAQPGFQKQFTEQRELSLPQWANRTHFDHFYRFAINTRVSPGQVGKRLRQGDPIVLPQLHP